MYSSKIFSVFSQVWNVLFFHFLLNKSDTDLHKHSQASYQHRCRQSKWSSTVPFHTVSDGQNSNLMFIQTHSCMISCSLTLMLAYIKSKKDIQCCLDRLFTLREEKWTWIQRAGGVRTNTVVGNEGSTDTVYSVLNTYLTLSHTLSSLQSAKRGDRHGWKLD